MKVLCTDHIDVSVNAERAFSAVVDIARWPVWFSSVVCAQHPDALPVALGEELSVCLNAGKRRWRETFEVSRFVRNAFLSLEGAFSAARRIDFRFEQRGPLTRIASSIGYRVFGGPLATAFDAAFKRRRVRADLRESLLRLKSLLEEAPEPALAHERFEAILTPALAAPARSLELEREPAGAV